MTFKLSPTHLSQYLEYLPALFQTEADTEDAGALFIGRFLLGFEHILSGIGDTEITGLEEIIDRLHTFFDPGPDSPDDARTPEDFLPWLASWVALTLRDDWSMEERRRFIARIVPTYRRRGTKAGLIDALNAYTGGVKVEVSEFQKAFQIGVASTIGVDTLFGGTVPHYFEVKMALQDISSSGAVDFARKQQIVEAIINMEKPAHTYYELKVTVTQTIQIGIQSTVGQDTILGDIPK